MIMTIFKRNATKKHRILTSDEFNFDISLTFITYFFGQNYCKSYEFHRNKTNL